MKQRGHGRLRLPRARLGTSEMFYRLRGPAVLTFLMHRAAFSVMASCRLKRRRVSVDQSVGWRSKEWLPPHPAVALKNQRSILI
jgi:hypothetical protein